MAPTVMSVIAVFYFVLSRQKKYFQFVDGVWIIESIYFEVKDRIFEIEFCLFQFNYHIFVLGFQAYLVWDYSGDDDLEI